MHLSLQFYHFFRKSSLVSDPKPKPDPISYVSAIDMVLLVDVNDEIVLKRAHGRTGKTRNRTPDV